jgi:NTE family protein
MAELALVLGAGGLRGLAHAGVVQALHEGGIAPDAFVGASSGALVAACRAALGWEPRRIAEVAGGVSNMTLLSLAARRPFLREFRSFLKLSDPRLEAVLEGLEHASFEVLHDGALYLGVTCVDLIARQEVFYVTGGDAAPPLIDAVLGSMAIPVLFPARAIAVGGKSVRLADGGLATTVPIERAFLPPIAARRALAVDLGVFTGWSERRLGHFEEIKRRFGVRLMILKPRVERFGTVHMRGQQARDIIAAGRDSVTREVLDWCLRA